MGSVAGDGTAPRVSWPLLECQIAAHKNRRGRNQNGRLALGEKWHSVAPDYLAVPCGATFTCVKLPGHHNAVFWDWSCVIVFSHVFCMCLGWRRFCYVGAHRGRPRLSVIGIITVNSFLAPGTRVRLIRALVAGVSSCSKDDVLEWSVPRASALLLVDWRQR